jgi:hypothetical protein
MFSRLCPFTSCLKLYCVCFQVGDACSKNCKCKSCQNTQGSTARDKAIKEVLSRRPDAFEVREKKTGEGCSCKKNRYVEVNSVEQTCRLQTLTVSLSLVAVSRSTVIASPLPKLVRTANVLAMIVATAPLTASPGKPPSRSLKPISVQPGLSGWSTCREPKQKTKTQAVFCKAKRPALSNPHPLHVIQLDLVTI